MAGIGGGLVAMLAAVAVIAAVQPAPPTEAVKEVAEVRPAPAPRPAGSLVRPTAPTQVWDTAANPAGAGEWKPLVPHNVAPTTPSPSAPSSQPMGVPFAAGDRRPVEAAPVYAPSDWPTPPAQRLDLCSEDQLFARLRDDARLIDLDSVKGTSARLLAAKAADARSGHEAARAAKPEESLTLGDVLASRADLAGLPMRGASQCRLSAEAAGHVEQVARPLHCFQPWPAFVPRDDDLSVPAERNSAFIAFLEKQTKWLKEENVPPLVQMLQIEGPGIRHQLTKMLASIAGRKAGAALARRALFDLSPDLRLAAVQALKDRPPDDYRQALLDGLRYPWPPVAEHAAEALAAVDDRAAVPILEAMLDLPDPSAPVYNGKQKWVAPELVKVNHLRNCLLCHAPSSDRTDRVRGLIPEPGEELPEKVYSDRVTGRFIHADVTYLRQDFSVMERVETPDKWPAVQRFDYLVRQREATDDEIIEAVDAGPWGGVSYPQREAVRFALEKLTASQREHAAAASFGP